jgi:hypothetical protein
MQGYDVMINTMKNAARGLNQAGRTGDDVSMCQCHRVWMPPPWMNSLGPNMMLNDYSPSNLGPFTKLLHQLWTVIWITHDITE